MLAAELPTEIYIQIVQSALIDDPSSLSTIKSTSSLFRSVASSSDCLAALYIGMYGASVYASVLALHPLDFTAPVLVAVSELCNQRIPNGVLHLYSNTADTNPSTLAFLKRRCVQEDDSDEFMDLFNAYIAATKIEGGLQDRSHLIRDLRAFINRTGFIPAYASKSRVCFILEHLPVCLFEESLNTALFLCQNTLFDREDVNSKLVAKIMWDYGYLKEWSSVEEKNARVDFVMRAGGFKLHGRAVVDIIRRNTWVSWMHDLEERVSREDIVSAVKAVIVEQLQRRNGGGYMVAQRLAATYQIDAEYVDRVYDKCNQMVLL